MHVELFLQFNAKVHGIKWKLGPPCNKSNFNLSPPILALFVLDSPPPQSGFSGPLLIIIAQSLIARVIKKNLDKLIVCLSLVSTPLYYKESMS